MALYGGLTHSRCKARALTSVCAVLLILLLPSSVGSVFSSHDHTEGAGQGPQVREVTLGHITWFIFKAGPKGCSEHDDLVLDLSFLFAWRKKEDRKMPKQNS